MESDQPDPGAWVRVDPSLSLSEIEFLSVEDLTTDQPDLARYLLGCLRPSNVGEKLPGSARFLWRTPKVPPPAPQQDLFSFGSATAVFDSLQQSSGQTHTPSFDVPIGGTPPMSTGPPLSLPPAFIPGLPIPASPAQHIHINNFTANVNFPPGHHPPTVTGSQGPTSLPSQPLPFTVGSHYPGQYVAPFPQATPSPPVYHQTGSYQTPAPMVVYQPPHLHLSMYPPHYPPASPNESQGRGHQRTNSSSSSNIMFGSTPVVSVRHSSSDEEGEEQQQQAGGQFVHLVGDQDNHHQVHNIPVYETQPIAQQMIDPHRPNPSQVVLVDQQPPPVLDTPTIPPKPTHPPLTPRQSQERLTSPELHSQSSNISTNTPPTSESPTPAKSWASLFSPSPGSLAPGILCPGEKPTARIPPFTPHGNGPAPIPCTPEEKELGTFLRNYQLNHIAPAFLPRGLTNRSNWCFVNAILQALLACPPFYNLMKSLPIPGPGLKSGKSSTPMIDAIVEFVNEFTPLETMSKTMKKDKARKKEDLPTGNPLEPSYVYRTLLQLESETFRCVEGRQEDAEEFLTCLLNMISDEMLALLKLTEGEVEIPPVRPAEETGGQEWLEVGARGRSCITRRIADQNGLETPVQQLALGLCRSSVRAASKETSATLQPFFTLQLDIGHDTGATSVEKALIENFAAEQLDGYICSKTNQEVEASRSPSLEDLPPILILHLKRFVYDGTTGGCQKVMKVVEISVDLEIPRDILSMGSKSKYTTKQRQYKLFGVVYHNGTEATKGHYIADVYHTGYASWLRCDDSSVTPTVERLVTAPSPTSVPYILFYRRGDTMVGVEKTVK